MGKYLKSSFYFCWQFRIFLEMINKIQFWKDLGNSQFTGWKLSFTNKGHPQHYKGHSFFATFYTYYNLSNQAIRGPYITFNEQTSFKN